MLQSWNHETDKDPEHNKQHKVKLILIHYAQGELEEHLMILNLGQTLGKFLRCTHSDGMIFWVVCD